MQYPANELGILAAYLSVYEGDPVVQNRGLIAGENLRGLGAVEPASWFSLAKAQEAVRTKRDLSLQDVSGGRVIALGTAQTVGGKKLAAGDQVFFQPVTKTVQAIKTFKALQAESLRLSTPTPPSAGSPSAAPSKVASKKAAPAKAPVKKPAPTPAKKPAPAKTPVKVAAPAPAKKPAPAKTPVKVATPAPAKKPAPAKTPVKVATPAKAPAGKSTEPRKAGMSKANVGQIQDILIKLGAKIGRDGLWGPKTAAQWVSSAQRRKLDGAIDRAGPMDAWIVQATFDALARAAGVQGAKPQGQPESAKTESAAVTTPTPGGVPPSKLEPITSPQLLAVFKAFNKNPKKAPEIQAAWADIAKANKLDATSMITKLGLEVVPKTRDTLVQKAARRIDAAKMIAASTASLPVKTLQQAMKFANQTPTYSGRLSGVGVTGAWDGKTEDAFFVYFNIPSANISTWELALKTLVAKNKSIVKLPANFAAQAQKDAANLSKVKKTVAKAETAQKKAVAAVKKNVQAVDAEVAANAAQATTLTSVFTLQQALSEIREQQKAGKIPGPVLPGIKLTGKWDANTDKALFATFSDKMWSSSDTIPKGAWEKLLNRVLVKSANSGTAGLYGMFGDLAAAPTGANYIRLPAAVAQKVQQIAADFVARSAKSGVMNESTPEVTLPVPQGGGTVAGEPILITGQAPANEPAPAPAPAPVIDFRTGEQMQVPMIESPDGGRVDMPVAPQPVPLPAEYQQQSAGGAATATAAAPNINISVPSTEPSFAPAGQTAIAPAPAAEAKPDSNPWMIALAVAAGASALFLLAHGEKEHRDEQRAMSRSKRKKQ